MCHARRIWEVESFVDGDGICVYDPAALVEVVQDIVLGSL